MSGKSGKFNAACASWVRPTSSYAAGSRSSHPQKELHERSLFGSGFRLAVPSLLEFIHSRLEGQGSRVECAPDGCRDSEGVGDHTLARVFRPTRADPLLRALASGSLRIASRGHRGRSVLPPLVTNLDGTSCFSYWSRYPDCFLDLLYRMPLDLLLTTHGYFDDCARAMQSVDR